jgi:hypothetical protein
LIYIRITNSSLCATVKEGLKAIGY